LIILLSYCKEVVLNKNQGGEAVELVKNYNLFALTLVCHLLAIVSYVVLGLVAFVTIVVLFENITNSQLGEWLDWLVSFFTHDSIAKHQRN
jgi:hypothetical protein